MPFDLDVRDVKRPTCLEQLSLDFTQSDTRIAKFAERFWRHVERADGCWLWTGSRLPRGYGTFYGGKRTSAHRFSWELHFGSIPSGLHVCHRCDNPPCVRPDHLFLGTHTDNVRDMWAKGRGHLQRPGVLEAVHVRGSSHPQAKLTETEVLEIRSLCAAGANRQELAFRFGVGKATIDKIAWRQTWRHVA